jgi:hypothetical protein
MHGRCDHHYTLYRAKIVVDCSTNQPGRLNRVHANMYLPQRQQTVNNYYYYHFKRNAYYCGGLFIANLTKKKYIETVTNAPR